MAVSSLCFLVLWHVSQHQLHCSEFMESSEEWAADTFGDLLGERSLILLFHLVVPPAGIARSRFGGNNVCTSRAVGMRNLHPAWTFRFPIENITNIVLCVDVFRFSQLHAHNHIISPLQLCLLCLWVCVDLWNWLWHYAAEWDEKEVRMPGAWTLSVSWASYVGWRGGTRCCADHYRSFSVCLPFIDQPQTWSLQPCRVETLCIGHMSEGVSQLSSQ